MPSALPPILCSCFERCLATPSQTLVTSVLDASANWLTVRLVSAAIYGTDQEQQRISSDLDRNPSTFDVVLVSFLRPLELWIEIGKKMNLDIVSLIAKHQLAYIDGLTNQITSHASVGAKLQPLRSHSLEDISKSIVSARQSLHKTSASTTTKSLIILDGIDFVLASQPDVDRGQLSRFLLSLQASFTNVVLTASSDSPLLHNTDTAATPLEQDHGIFLRLASHQSSFVLQVRPLDTGSAQDVTGVVRVSRGGALNETAMRDLPVGEWLYHVKTDGSLRLWGRGE